MGTPIDHKEIRKGDKVREITHITSHRDYTADMDGNTLNRYGDGDKSWELLDRPRKLIHAKGTTLYLKHDHHNAKKGDPVTVLEDYFEDQRMVRAVQADGFKDGYPYDYWLTTEKPRVLKWAKGTRLWFKDSAENRTYNHEGEYVVQRDVYEYDMFVDHAHFPSRFTDEKPEPHPVGAIRWVTEDCKSAYGKPFKQGERVTIDSEGGQSTKYDISVRADSDGWQYWFQSKLLSETLVEPEPTLVAVPLPAIEKLRDQNNRAYGTCGTGAKNDIRRDAIGSFLNGAREVKTALRGDEW